MKIAALEKGDRRRWFWVYVVEATPRMRYKGLIKFDGRTHRGITTFELFEAMQFRLQCEAEVAELELDGWTRTAPPTPRSLRP